MLQVNDFISVLDGLQAAQDLPDMYAGATVGSSLLRKCVLLAVDGGQFPDMKAAIHYFRTSFDAATAKKDGVIRPKPGVDTLFDEAKVSYLSEAHWCISLVDRTWVRSGSLCLGQF